MFHPGDIDVTLEAGDVEIGAVEIKNSTDDTRATVGANGLYVDVRTSALPTGAATESSLSSLNGKVTACNTGAVVVSSGAITETNSGTIAGDTTSIDGKITACNTGAVVVASGAITETNSGTIAGDTTSIDGKITACNTGAVVIASGSCTVSASDLDIRNLGKDSDKVAIYGSDDGGTNMRLIKTDSGGAIQVDLEVASVTVSSGAITETNSGTIAGDTTSIDGKITACNTGAVVVASGAITETNSGTIAGDTTSIDGKITACNTGAVVVASGAITETNSGTISTNTGTIAGDTTSIDGKITACNTGAVVVASGAITETNSGTISTNTGTIAGDTTSIDSKITACDTDAVAPKEPSNINTSAYAASLVVKDSAGTAYEIRGYNSKASAQFMLILDSAALPADTAVPEDIIYVGANQNFSITYPQGKAFAAGIVVCNSSTGPTKTIGSADCWFSAEFI